MRLVPFTRTFAPEEQDPKLGEKLRAELPLIAKWMVEGAVAWQREGLKPPQQVMAATADYRSESDTFSQWFDEKLMVVEGGEVKAKEAFASYGNWCEQNKERAVTRTRFGERMSEKISGKRKSGDVWYVGVAWL
jgi:putative DNA primase/helicase